MKKKMQFVQWMILIVFLLTRGSVTIQEFQKNTGLMKAIINQDQTVRIFN